VRIKFALLLMLAMSLFPGAIHAQGTTIEFNRWDARIIARSGSDQLQIAETQEIRVIGGTLSRGNRFWTRPVQIQNVFIVTGSDNATTELTAGNSAQRGAYALSQSGDQTTLSYTLPTPQNSGATFVVQINYLTTSPTSGMVDWRVVPAEHDFTVRSSTVRITLPAGQVPDASLIRSTQANAKVQVNGNDITITSGSPLAPRESFSIQIPFGSGVGAGSNNNTGGNTNPGIVPPVSDPGVAQPTDGSFQLPGLGGLAAIVCIGGGLLLLLLVVGGGGLLRSLLGGVVRSGLSGGGLGGLGGGRSSGLGGLGGLFGNSRNNSAPGPFNQSSPPPAEPPVERGFRPSADQDRNIGKVGDDKDSGGGASFS